MKSINLFLIATAFSFTIIRQSKAASYTATMNGNWTTSTIWSPTAPTGGPGSGDDVTINATVAVNANTTVNSLNILSAGTLTINNFTLQVNGNTTIGGTFTPSNNISLSFLGDFINNGIFNFSGSNNTITYGGNVAFGTSLPNTQNATFVFTGTNKIISGNLSINNGAWTISSGASYTVNGTLMTQNNDPVVSANSTLIVSPAGYLNGNSRKLILGSNTVLELQGTASLGNFNSYDFTTNPNTVKYTTTTGQTVINTNYYNLVVNNPGTVTLPAVSLIINGNLSILGGTLSGYNGNNYLSVKGNIINNGIFDASLNAGNYLNLNGGTAIHLLSGTGIFKANGTNKSILLNDTKGAVVLAGSNFTIGGLVLTAGSFINQGTLTVSNNMTIPNTSGVSFACDQNSTTTFSGTLTNAGTFQTSCGDLINVIGSFSNSGQIAGPSLGTCKFVVTGSNTNTGSFGCTGGCASATDNIIYSSATLLTGGAAHVGKDVINNGINAAVPSCLSITMSANDTICNGTIVTLTANGLPAGGTYAWSTGDGNVSVITVNPATTTTYFISYTNGSMITAQQITVVNPLPTANAQASSVQVCGSSSITLNSNAGNGTAPYAFTWSSNPAGFISSAADPITTPSANTTYTVLVKDQKGCSATVSSIGVNALIANVGTNQISCPDAPVVLGGSPTAIGGTGAYHYSWTGDNGSAYTVANPTVNPTATTVYTVNVTDDGVNGCTATDTIQVTITTSFSAKALASASAICDGSSVTLSVHQIGSTSPYYQWKGDNGFLSTSANPTDNPTSSTDYTVTISDTYCGSATSTVEVTVNPLPTATATAITSAVCQGGTITLSATDGGLGSTYAWSGPNSYSGTGSNPSFTATSTAFSGIYTVTASANSCTAVATASITVNSLPTVIAGAISSSVCLGNNINLSASDGGAGSTFAWSGPNGYTDNGSTPGFTANSTAYSGIYTVTASLNSCTSTATTTVTVNALPTPTFTGDAGATSCANTNIIYSTQAGMTNYKWNISGTFNSDYKITSGGITGNTVTLQWLTAGSETVSVNYTNANGCSDTTAAALSTTTVTVTPPPTAASPVIYCQYAVASQLSATGTSFIWGLTANNISSVGGTTLPTGNTVYADNTYSNKMSYFTVNTNVTILSVDWAVAPNNNVTGVKVAIQTSTGGTITNGNQTNAAISENANATTLKETSTFTNLVLTPGNYRIALSAGSGNFKPVNNPIYPQTEISGSISITSNSASQLFYNLIFSYPPVTIAPTPITTVAGTTNYYVKQTSDGCTSPNDAIVVKINPAPTVTVTGGGNICIGTTANLSVNGATTYVWSNQLGSGSPVMVNPTFSTTYAVTGTESVNNCSNTAAVIVIVNPLPTVTTNGDITACSNAKTTLTASGANTYTWDNGLGSGASQTIYPVANAVYNVTGADINGCTDTASIAVTVIPSPTVTVTGGGTICNGNSSTFTASGANSYIWNNGLGSNPSQTVNPAATTVYTVTGTNLNNCSNTSQILITVNNKPAVPTIKQSGDTLYTDATNGIQWYNSMGTIGGATGTYYVIAADDSYYMTATNNCGSVQSNTLTAVFTGIEKQNNNAAIQIYPNPVTDQVNIVFNNSKETFTMEVFNIVGQVIMSKQLNNSKSAEQIDLSGQPAGIYFVKLQSAGNRIIKKIIKE